MANSIYIDVSQFSKAIEKLNAVGKDVLQQIDERLSINAEEIASKAKANLARPYPEGAYDMGGLANSIDGTKNNKPFEKHITVNANYASFIEFGTGKYAAQYVSTLPPTWQEFASGFKGQKGNGTFDEFVLRLIDWVHRKGITGTYSVKTQRRKGKKSQQLFEDAETAYQIALSIIRNGIHPHPFLFPAYEAQRPKILEDLKNILKDI